MATPPVDIILEAFESTIVMDLSGALTVETAIGDLDVSANATIEVSLSEMRKIFTYHSDSVDVIDASATDLLFYVNSDSTPILPEDRTGFAGPLLFNPANAFVDMSGIYAGAANDKTYVCHDFTRYLASKLFNTHYAVDLFANELDLLNSIRVLCDASAGHVWGNIISLADDVNDELGLEYSDASTNLCCAIFRQMIASAPSRFANIASDCADMSGTELTMTPTPTSKYFIPFVVNDTIMFKLIISPCPDQQLLTGTDLTDVIESRSYSITLKLKADPTVLVVAPDELPVV